MQMQMRSHEIANKYLYLLPSDSYGQPVFLFISSICLYTFHSIKKNDALIADDIIIMCEALC